MNSVRIRFIAGYADAESIPYRVIDGLVLYLQQLYDGIDRRHGTSPAGGRCEAGGLMPILQRRNSIRS